MQEHSPIVASALAEWVALASPVAPLRRSSPPGLAVLAWAAEGTSASVLLAAGAFVAASRPRWGLLVLGLLALAFSVSASRGP